jgi:phosphate transport system protein
MSHLDIEIKRLKNEVLEMNSIILLQMNKSREAFMNFDKELSREVNFNEKRVNALELKIDKDCENIFALFNPLAVDLRFVLASLKINYNLERIGDIADGICRYVMEAREPFDKKLLEITRIDEMFATSIEMLEDMKKAFEYEDTKIARVVFQKDDKLDELNAAANHVIEKYIKENTNLIAPALHIISTIRKLERTGDQIKNVAEEIIFYLEAKVLKHGSPGKLE